MAITFEALAGRLGIDVSEWRRGLGQARAATEQFAAGFKVVAGQVQQLGRQMSATFAAAGAAMAAAATMSVKASANFEQSMARVRALLSGQIADTKALDAAYARLAAQAKQLGADTVFTSQQAADAMSFFAKAGFSVEEIYRAMPDTLNLAAAGLLQIEDAANIASKIMRGMGLDAGDLSHAVDVLTKATVTSNTDLQQLGEAMKFVGPSAKAAGLSIEGIVAPIQLLSDAGIQAEMAGTTMRGVLSQLAKGGREVRKVFDELGVEFKNTDGSLRPLDRIIDDFNRRLEETGQTTNSLGLAMAAFGARPGQGFVALLAEGGQKLREYQARLEDAGGTAARIAGIQRDTLGMAWERLTGQIDNLRLAIGEQLSPAFRELAERITAWLEINSDLISSGVGEWWEVLVKHVSAVGDAFGRMLNMAQPAISALRTSISSVKLRAEELFNSMPQWAKDAAIVAGSLLGISTVLGTLGGSIPIVGGLFASIAALLNPLGLLTGAGSLLASVWAMLVGAFGFITAAAGTCATMMTTGVAAAFASIGPLATSVFSILSAGWAAAGGFIMPIIIWLADLVVGFGALASEVGLLSALWTVLGSAGTGVAGVIGSLLVGGLATAKGAFMALLATIAPVLVKIALVGAAIGSIVAVMAALWNGSQTTQDTLKRTFSAIADGATQAVRGGLKLLQDWWAEHRGTVIHVGEQIVVVFEKIVEYGGMAAKWMYSNGGLKQAFEAVGWALGKLFETLEAVIGVLQGDFRFALSLADKLLAAVNRSLAWMIEGLGKIITLGTGDPFGGLAESLRNYADAQEREAASIDATIALERKRKEEADDLAKRQEALAAKRAKWAEQEKDQIRDIAKAKEDAEASARDKAEKSYSEHARDVMRAAGVRATNEYGIEQILPPEEIKKLEARLAAKGQNVPTKPDVSSAFPPAAGTDGATATGEPLVGGSGGGAGGLGGSSQMLGGGTGGGTGSGKDKPAVALDPHAVGRQYGRALASATREQALEMFKRLGQDLDKALQPGDAGKVSTANAETIFNNYKLLLSRMPEFSQEQWAKIEWQIKVAMKNAADSSGEMQSFYLDRVKQLADSGDKVFQDSAARQEEMAKRWMAASGAVIQQQMATTRQAISADLDSARKAGVPTEELRSIVELRDKVLEAMTAVKNSHGEARKVAVDELAATVKAYEEGYKKIVATVREAQAEEGGRAGRNATAADRAASVRERAQQRAEDRRQAIADRRAADQGGGAGGSWGGIQDIANGLSNMFTSALSSVGSSMASFANLVAGTKDPIQKLDLQIGHLKAQLAMSSVNASHSNVGGMTELQRQLEMLQTRRQEAVIKQTAERTAAHEAHNAAYRQREMQKMEQDREHRREQNLDLASMVSVGAVPPIVMNVNGVNDIRQAVDALEKEIRRRGLNRGPNGKRSIQSR